MNYYFAWMGGKNLIVKNSPSLSFAKEQAELWSGKNSLGASNMIISRLAQKSDVAICTMNLVSHQGEFVKYEIAKTE